MELLTDVEQLIAKGWEALGAIDRMDMLETPEQMDQQRATSRALISDFIRASKPFVVPQIEGSVAIE
ncbi:MAG: hypothetical protein K0R62_3465 [Nonomuraea muscovyensis]|nr:hypothetical protein [Nonomuraea muscovyensis]